MHINPLKINTVVHNKIILLCSEKLGPITLLNFLALLVPIFYGKVDRSSGIFHLYCPVRLKLEKIRIECRSDFSFLN